MSTDQMLAAIATADDPIVIQYIGEQVLHVALGNKKTLLKDCIPIQKAAWRRLHELSLDALQRAMRSESRTELAARLVAMGRAACYQTHVAAVEDELRSRNVLDAEVQEDDAGPSPKKPLNLSSTD